MNDGFKNCPFNVSLYRRKISANAKNLEPKISEPNKCEKVLWNNCQKVVK